MKEDDNISARPPAFSRRDLMKLGGGVVAMTQMLNASKASAKDSIHGLARAGYKNESGRSAGNGPMDETSRQLVTYALSFSESKLTDPVIDALAYVMVDAIGCIMAGFESEPARISARMARSTRSDMKSTVLGYGVTTSPELAAFANGTMERFSDFSDAGWQGNLMHGHFSTMIPAILAVAEALHSTGRQVLAAVTLAYEVMAALDISDTLAGKRGWDSLYMGPSTTLAVGKLLGLNEDRLANALSLSLVSHLAVGVSHSTGPLSMWKGCHDPEAVHGAVRMALLAREGMTGPCQPFEGQKGVWEVATGPFKLHLPASPDGRMIVQDMIFKRFPSETLSLGILSAIPEIREWTKVADIESIQVEMRGFAEIAEEDKWDPRNSETADHSMPYLIARALIDGEIYLDSFTEEKLTDPAVRLLMDKMTIQENPDLRLSPRITVRTRSGGQLVKQQGEPPQGVRPSPRLFPPMSHEEVNAKFNRICAFRHVPNEQRDRVRSTWSNLGAVKDIGEAIRTVAKFGQPLPL